MTESAAAPVAACAQAEAGRNRRLVPDLYLGVRGVAGIEELVELTDEDDLGVVEPWSRWCCTTEVRRWWSGSAR